jgi:uncharacterized DUF497 family protein
MGAKQHGNRRFTWDDDKRRRVRKDHGIDLADLPAAFDGPTLEMEAQEHHIDGLRMKILALSRGNVTVVVYTEADDNSEVRLITAWRANKVEQSLYYQTFFGETYGE